jgi:hypothetical protein
MAAIESTGTSTEIIRKSNTKNMKSLSRGFLIFPLQRKKGERGLK